MRNLKLLNSKFFIFIIIIFVFFKNNLNSTETVDIWNLENKENIEITTQNPDDQNSNLKKSLYDKIKSKNIEASVFNDENIDKNIMLAGLYDPQENNLKIDMWTNSNGEKIKIILNKINKLNLSEDANNILDIVLLTNSYFPKENINSEEFLKFKFDYLIKKKKS